MQGFYHKKREKCCHGKRNGTVAVCLIGSTRKSQDEQSQASLTTIHPQNRSSLLSGSHATSAAKSLMSAFATKASCPGGSIATSRVIWGNQLKLTGLYLGYASPEPPRCLGPQGVTIPSPGAVWHGCVDKSDLATPFGQPSSASRVGGLKIALRSHTVVWMLRWVARQSIAARAV